LIERVHLEIARVFFGLPEAEAYGVGGGMAAIAYGVVDRRTEDIDLFRDRARDGARPQEAADAFAIAARSRGWSVQWVHRYPDHARIGVGTPDALIVVDIALETIELPLSSTPLGPTLAERDVAVGKIIALFDRAEARDFVDVFAFVERHGRDELLDHALARDAGLRREDLAERLRRITELLGPSQLPEQYRERFGEIREFFVVWREELLR
jgi:hypothetical protein